MRLVVDTNVFISAVLKESSWPGMVIRWLDEHDGLLRTSSTEQEVFAVLERPRIASHVIPAFVARIHRIFDAAERVTIREQVTGCRDPRDDKFLELAVNGRADLIVSGDNDLLVLNVFRGIPIVNPAVFGRVWAGSS